MCYLPLITILFGSLIGGAGFNLVNVGGGLLAQQAPPAFDNAVGQSESPPLSAEATAVIPKADVSGPSSKLAKSDENPPVVDQPKDLDAYSQELRRAVNSGEMTEQAAVKAWEEANSGSKRADGKDDVKGWVEEHLVIFLATVYSSLFALIGGAFLICYRFVKRREKTREVALETTTSELGLKFEPEGDELLMSDLSSLPLFNQGRRKKLFNLIVADTPDLQVQVFDYQFTTGHGRSQTTHRVTVVSVRSVTLAVPELQVRPRKAFLDGIKEMFGRGGIELDQYPAFSKKFVLKSDQPAQACGFLDAKMVAACERNNGCSLECQSGVLLHFRANKRVDPDAQSIRRFIGEGFTLFQDVSERLDRNA